MPTSASANATGTSASASAPLPATVESTLSSEATAALSTAITTSMADFNVPGAVVGVWLSEDGEYVSATGYANLDPNTPMGLDDTFLVGLIIEKVTATKLEDEVASRIIGPLRLTKTTFPTEPTRPAPFATGYQYDPDAKTFDIGPAVDPSFLWAAGAMVTSLDGLKVWAEALATGELITPELQAERESFQTITLDGVPPFYAAMEPGYGPLFVATVAKTALPESIPKADTSAR